MKWLHLSEDPSKIHESFQVKPQILDHHRHELSEGLLGSVDYLLPHIEAIHVGTTRNYTNYPAESLMGDKIKNTGVYSWLYPYARPVIYNHDTNTRATGRIQSAVFSSVTQAGRPGIIVVPKITDKEAMDGIMSSRLLTVSVGATTDSVTCSICGQDIINDGFCGHFRGEQYDGQTAIWTVGDLTFDELSWVNVPADSDAMITDQGNGNYQSSETFAGGHERELIDLGKEATQWVVSKERVLQEGLNIEHKPKGAISMSEEEIKALQDKVTSLEKDVADTKEALDKSKKETEDAKAELTKSAEGLKSKEDEVASLTSEKEALNKKVTELTESLEMEKTAHQQVLDANTQMAEEKHADLLQRVADLRVRLGKESAKEDGSFDLESIKGKFSGRSTESLNDTLSDLMGELPKSFVEGTQRVIQTVTNPGQKDVTDPAEPRENQDLDTEAVIRNLFAAK